MFYAQYSVCGVECLLLVARLVGSHCIVFEGGDLETVCYDVYFFVFAELVVFVEKAYDAGEFVWSFADLRPGQGAKVGQFEGIFSVDLFVFEPDEVLEGFACFVEPNGKVPIVERVVGTLLVLDYGCFLNGIAEHGYVGGGVHHCSPLAAVGVGLFGVSRLAAACHQQDSR
jgi:hypothetical protein